MVMFSYDTFIYEKGWSCKRHLAGENVGRIVVNALRRPTDARNQTGFNNERFVGWCAGSSFC